MKKQKLQKLLQSVGLDSRRNLRAQIHDGMFKVNQVTVTDPGFLVDPHSDHVHFKRKEIPLKIVRHSYYIFNKPLGVISTLSDPQKRLTVKDFLKGIPERVYPVGRLDYQSEGLLILTNDGDLTNFILSTKNKIPKLYQIKVQGIVAREKMEELQKKGIFMDGSRVRPERITFLKRTHQNHCWLLVSIIEGKKHIIRNFFKYAGHPVEKLKRVSIGSFKLGSLKPGMIRELTDTELAGFKRKFNYTDEN